MSSRRSFAAAAFRFYPARRYRSTVRSPPVVLKFSQFEIARDVDDELTGTKVMPSALPIPLNESVVLLGVER